MLVTILRFEWEALADQIGVWHHTEYVIEFQLKVDPIADSEGDPELAGSAHPIRWTIRRRYTDFLKCHNELTALHMSDLPELPPKEAIFQRMFGSFSVRRDWQELRRNALHTYASALLSTPELSSIACVQQLLALSACSRLSEQPEPPDLVRVKPLSKEGRFLEGLEVSVRQIGSGILEDSTLLRPVDEIVVVFRALPSQCGIECGEEVLQNLGITARSRFKVESAIADITQFVKLDAGRTYSIEACSVSVTGIQSLPVKLIARVPHSCERSSKEGAGSSGYLEEEKLATSQRKNAASLRVKHAKFRGTAASEYTAVVAEKTRQCFEKSPYQLLSGSVPQNSEMSMERSSNDEESFPEKLHVQVHIEEIQQDASERTIHREVELLDDEREFIRQRNRLDDSSCVSKWLTEMTGIECCIAIDGGNLTSLREALLSGEALCELANAVARCGGEAKCPVPSFHHQPTTKFRRMENVSMFIKACRDFYKIPEHQLFCTGDLTEEGRDMSVVVQCLLALGRKVKVIYPIFNGPQLTMSSPVESFEDSTTSLA